MRSPVADPVREKLYYATRECELKSIDLDDGSIEKVAMLECEEVQGAVLVPGLENLLFLKVDGDELLCHNLASRRTEKVSSSTPAALLPASTDGAIVLVSQQGTLDVVSV